MQEFIEQYTSVFRSWKPTDTELYKKLIKKYVPVWIEPSSYLYNLYKNNGKNDTTRNTIL